MVTAQFLPAHNSYPHNSLPNNSHPINSNPSIFPPDRFPTGSIPIRSHSASFARHFYPYALRVIFVLCNFCIGVIFPRIITFYECNFAQSVQFVMSSMFHRCHTLRQSSLLPGLLNLNINKTKFDIKFK